MDGFETLLSPLARRKILDGAFAVLEDHGVECTHARARERLAEVPGVRVGPDRVRFAREAVAAHLERRRTEQPPDDVRFGMYGPWCSFSYCDPLTNQVRMPTESEAVDAARLIDALTAGTGAFGGAVPVYLPGVDPRLQTFRQEICAVTYTRRLGGKLTALDRGEIGYVKALYKAAGRRYKLALQGLISPLRLNSEVMDTFFEEIADPDLDIEISCSIPMAGATAPVVFPAALIQAVAETLAVDFVFNALAPTRRFDCLTVRLEPFDMKSANIVFGSPEWCVLNRACVELERDLRGTPRRYGIFRSNSRSMDAQAMIERSMSVLYQAMNGVRRFGAVGQLCVDEVFSPLQAVIDVQILKYVERVVRGLDASWDESVDTVALLREGDADGTFLMHDTTAEHFRTFYGMDTLFTYENLNAWRDAGSKGLEDRAREELARLLAGTRFELDAARREEVDRVASEGTRYLESLA